MQRWRKNGQIAVFFTFLFIFPLINLYGNALNAYRPNFTGDLFKYGAYVANTIVTENSTAWNMVTLLDGFSGLSSLPAQTLAQWLENFKGAPWTITLFGITISDPLAVISVFLVEKSVPISFILSALIPLILVITLGRVFCGWICPMSLILELNLKLRKLLEINGVPVRNYRFSRNWKFVLLASFLIMSLMGMQVLTYLLPYVQLGRNAFYWFFYGSLSVGLTVVGLIILFELLLSERGWCRYFCPSGALLTILSKYRLLRINHKEERCLSGCSTCARVCDQGLEGKVARLEAECTNCGQCVSACPQKALSFNINIVKKESGILIKDNNLSS